MPAACHTARVITALGWAIFAAVQPLGITAYVVVLTRGGRRDAWGFVIGWVLCAAVVIGLTVGLDQSVQAQQGSTTVAATAWAEVVLGLAALLLLVVRRVRRRRTAASVVAPVPGAADAAPAEESPERRAAGPVGAAVLAALLQGWPIVAAAAAAVLGATSPGAGRVLGLVLVLLVTSSTYVTAQVVSGIRPERTEEWLQSLRRRLEENRDTIVDVVLLVIGAWLLVQGAVALLANG